MDQVQGGIGQAPKFPQAPLFQMFWRAWKRTKNQEFKSAVVLTLTRMSQGGIYDHLGGGFARYSVDANWLVPHFEKMLYDNAELIGLLTLTWQETRDLLFQERVREIVEWLEREMLAPERGWRPRLRRVARCGFGRRGGQVLCLDRGRDRPGARRGVRVLQAALRRERGGQLGRSTRSSAARSAGDARCRRRRAARQGARQLLATRAGACGRAGTTRCWWTGTG